MAYGAAKSLRVYANDVNQWLPKGFRRSQKVPLVSGSHFGVDEMVVASWEDCKLDNPAVDRFEWALEDLKENGIPIFDRVVSGPEMLDEIKNVGCSENAAFQSAEGTWWSVRTIKRRA